MEFQSSIILYRGPLLNLDVLCDGMVKLFLDEFLVLNLGVYFVKSMLRFFELLFDNAL